MEGKAGQAAPERLRCPLDRKNGQSHYGDKNHINVDRRHKLVRDHDDFNGEMQEGIGYCQNTTRGSFRCSTAAGYLKTARSRGNLNTETGALAHRVLFGSKKVIGVEYSRGGQTRQAMANGEVILTGRIRSIHPNCWNSPASAMALVSANMAST